MPLATLCDAAQVLPDGRLDIKGAAPEWWWVPDVPWQGSIPFAAVGSLEGHDDPTAIRLTIQVVRLEDGSIVGGFRESRQEVQRDPDLFMEGGAVHVPVVGYLDVTLDRVGAHLVVVEDGSGTPLAQVLFGVRLRLEPPTSTSSA
jgi:hypothetical protein